MVHEAPLCPARPSEQQGATVPAFDIAACAGLMDGLTIISISAAQTIMLSRGDGVFRTKSDGSPVTTADEAAEATIRDGLSRLAPTLPIISEEEAERETRAVKSASYFLVDPLDGTREFIAGRDEYTVNIALVADGAPILGIVTAPALGLIWRGIVGHGAERLKFSADKASAKFCRLAEGTADLYPRFGPTRDWDVAAGHAVLAAAGGSVVEPDGAALVYGSPELRIPAFIAWGGPAPAERAVKG
jgi:3'(2'), 5'-bisphosphate nucleotidase